MVDIVSYKNIIFVKDAKPPEQLTDVYKIFYKRNALVDGHIGTVRWNHLPTYNNNNKIRGYTFFGRPGIGLTAIVLGEIIEFINALNKK